MHDLLAKSEALAVRTGVAPERRGIDHRGLGRILRGRPESLELGAVARQHRIEPERLCLTRRQRDDHAPRTHDPFRRFDLAWSGALPAPNAANGRLEAHFVAECGSHLGGESLRPADDAERLRPFARYTFELRIAARRMRVEQHPEQRQLLWQRTERELRTEHDGCELVPRKVERIEPLAVRRRVELSRARMRPWLGERYLARERIDTFAERRIDDCGRGLSRYGRIGNERGFSGVESEKELDVELASEIHYRGLCTADPLSAELAHVTFAEVGIQRAPAYAIARFEHDE